MKPISRSPSLSFSMFIDYFLIQFITTVGGEKLSQSNQTCNLNSCENDNDFYKVAYTFVVVCIQMRLSIPALLLYFEPLQSNEMAVHASSSRRGQQHANICFYFYFSNVWFFPCGGFWQLSKSQCLPVSTSDMFRKAEVHESGPIMHNCG